MRSANPLSSCSANIGEHDIAYSYFSTRIEIGQDIDKDCFLKNAEDH
jgi:hypothetical protein